MNSDEKNLVEKPSAMQFTKTDFARLVINDLSATSSGRRFLRRYTQVEVRDIIEGYKLDMNQDKLREISRLLWAKSPQYNRLINYFAGMAKFAHVITPIKDLKKIAKNKVMKQYTEIGELAKTMNIKHEMSKVMEIIFREDIFYGYIHKDKQSFFIQQMPPEICKATSVQDGILNYSVDMTYFDNRDIANEGWAIEILVKYREWKALREKNPKISKWVELDAKNTICIKLNESVSEIFPLFAGTFDSIFDIEAFKELRKDKEKLGNYMVLAQKLPMRDNSDNVNDFLIDKDFMMFFHNQASDVVPENVGIITSPMEIEPITFREDRADSDGVGKATRDFWEGAGASQLLFSSENNSSAGLAMSIKSDEDIVFNALVQIERWINRYLTFMFKDLMFNIRILPITTYNEDTIYSKYLEVAQYGVPVKSFLSASVGLDPIEVMNMSYLENDLLKMHEEWIPLMSSHTMPVENTPSGVAPKGEGTKQNGNGSKGAPKKDPSKISDETSRAKDKPNA